MTLNRDPQPEPSPTERRLAEEHGDDAKIYAEVRADAAAMRGANKEAERWDAVAEDLPSRDED